MLTELRKQQIPDLFILLFIVAVGGVLRFYDFSNIPMTHDELSAYYRLNFNSFRDLIEFGVKEDGHPAGVQVFLYYWSRIFGTGDMIIKLPFLLLGMGSILLAYKLALTWFNSTTALFVAAYVSSLQFAVMYSQIARPYIFGLFFCLLMVLFWTRIVFGTKGKSLAVLMGFVFSASVCSYTHHFSLLFMAMVASTGLFFVRKELRLRYILALFAIFLLYVPHLGVFFHQLGIGGLSWLGVPPNSFLLDYVKYIFHFSVLIYAAVFILFLIGIATSDKRLWPLSKFQYISIIWFVVPPVIGFLYSKFVSPLVQYSVLIFSFPFLLLFIFSFYKQSSQWFKMGAVALILLANISTLVWSRQHYDVFYKQPFKEYAAKTADFLAQHDVEDVRIVFQENPVYVNHYFTKFNPDTEFVSLYEKEKNPSEFRSIIAEPGCEYLICGAMPLEYFPIVKEYYPTLVARDFGFTYEFYIFSRGGAVPEKCLDYDPVFYNTMDFENEKEAWNISMCGVQDSSQFGLCALDSAQEWGPKFEYPLGDISSSRHDIIDIALDFEAANQGQIVCEIWKDSELVFWRSAKLHDFLDLSPGKQGQKAYLSFRLSSLFKKDQDLRDCTLKVYYWNIDKCNIVLDHFTIQARKGNPYAFALVQRI